MQWNETGEPVKGNHKDAVNKTQSAGQTTEFFQQINCREENESSRQKREKEESERSID